jgi:hypothetical protein
MKLGDRKLKKDVKLYPTSRKFKMDLQKAFIEIKLHQEGKIQLKTLSKVLDEL